MNSLTENKKVFLKSLKSDKGYKRYNGSTLRYGGGKSLAVGLILEHFPNNIKKVISPFIGGGSIEIAAAKELNLKVIGYDIFDLLINYWDQQLKNPKELANKLKTLQPTKQCYNKVKKILSLHWNKKDGYDGQLSPLDAAAYYYYNMQLSYGPGFLGWMSSNYKNHKTYQRIIEKVKNFYCPNLSVKVGKFQDVIRKHKNDFLYLDPPYFLDGDSRMFKGIYPMRNFPIHHNGFKHEELAKLLINHKGGFILSYNDCSWVRKTYKDFKIVELKWQYTMGQGETRIGFNRKNRNYDNTNIKSSHELLIIGEKR